MVGALVGGESRSGEGALGLTCGGAGEEPCVDFWRRLQGVTLLWRWCRKDPQRHPCDSWSNHQHG